MAGCVDISVLDNGQDWALLNGRVCGYFCLGQWTRLSFVKWPGVWIFLSWSMDKIELCKMAGCSDQAGDEPGSGKSERGNGGLIVVIGRGGGGTVVTSSGIGCGNQLDRAGDGLVCGTSDGGNEGPIIVGGISGCGPVMPRSVSDVRSKDEGNTGNGLCGSNAISAGCGRCSDQEMEGCGTTEKSNGGVWGNKEDDLTKGWREWKEREERRRKELECRLKKAEGFNSSWALMRECHKTIRKEAPSWLEGKRRREEDREISLEKSEREGRLEKGKSLKALAMMNEAEKLKLEEKKRKEKSGGKSAAWKFWRGKEEIDFLSQPRNIPADILTDRYPQDNYDTNTYSSRILLPSKFKICTDESGPEEVSLKVVVPGPEVVIDKERNLTQEDHLQKKHETGSTTTGNSSQEINLDSDDQPICQEMQLTGNISTGNQAQEENLKKIKSKLRKFAFISQEMGTKRKIELTGNSNKENVTGRNTPTPVANRKLHRRIDSPFTTPKGRLCTPENLSTGKLRRKGGIEKKKEIQNENVKKMKVTLIVDYFETLKGEEKAKKTKNDEQLRPKKLDLTSTVTGNVIGRRNEIVKTKENDNQPGRSLEVTAKLQHPIAGQRRTLRNEAGRAAHAGIADQNEA